LELIFEHFATNKPRETNITFMRKNLLSDKPLYTHANVDNRPKFSNLFIVNVDHLVNQQCPDALNSKQTNTHRKKKTKNKKEAKITCQRDIDIEGDIVFIFYFNYNVGKRKHARTHNHSCSRKVKNQQNNIQCNLIIKCIPI